MHADLLGAFMKALSNLIGDIWGVIGSQIILSKYFSPYHYLEISEGLG